MKFVFEAVGEITVLFVCTYLILRLYVFLKKVYRNQRKIKCICKHEYVKAFTWTHTNYDDITLRCRKCGKKKTITIWKDKEMED